MTMKSKPQEVRDRIWWKNWSENRVDIVKFKKESEKICHYCGKQITNKDELTVDHVVPISKLYILYNTYESSSTLFIVFRVELNRLL